MSVENYIKKNGTASERPRRNRVIGLLLCLLLVLAGQSSKAQVYYHVTNFSGTTNYAGINVGVTTSGSAGFAPFYPCGSIQSTPYYFNSGAGTFTYTFSQAVGSVKVAVNFASSGDAGQIHFIVNGSPYTLTSANMLGGVSPNCGDNTLATLSGGDLVNTGDYAGTPNQVLVFAGPITSITVANVPVATNACDFGVYFTPMSFYKISNFSGTTTVGTETVTVTNSGSAGFAPFYPCGNDPSAPYYFGSGTGQFNFAFSSPVTGVDIPVNFASSGGAGQEHFSVNGSGVTLTSANLAGGVFPNCGDNTLATISGGDLVNTGDYAGTPNEHVSLTGSINSVTVQNLPSGGNASDFGFFFNGNASALSMVNSAQSWTSSMNATVSLNSLLSVNDANSNLTLAWSVVVAPAHGSLTGFPYSGSATGGAVTPSGLNYVPTTSYTGNDAFTIQVTDGVNIVTATVFIAVYPPTPAPGYYKVTNFSGATNYGGVNVTVATSGSAGFAPFYPCGPIFSTPYYFGSGTGSFTYTFSQAVGSVMVPVNFASSGTAAQAHFTVNGSSYTLTSANMAGGVSPNCGDNTLATLSGGDLVNTGDFAGTPNQLLVFAGPITSITVSNVPVSANALDFGVYFAPMSMNKISNFSGTTTVGTETVTVTASGSAGFAPFYPCGYSSSAPYYFGSGAGQFDFSFSSPVNGVDIPMNFASSGSAGQEHFSMNGSGVALGYANLTGGVTPNCGDNTLASVSNGDLVNPTDYAGTPNEHVSLTGSINSISVQNVAGSANASDFGFFFAGNSTVLSFTGNPQSWATCRNATASLNSLLAATDLNTNLTLTWSVVVGPAHGTLGGFPYSGTATGSSVLPSGLTYTPTTSYTGSDAITVKVTDGVNVVTANINITVVAAPASISGTFAVCQGSTTTLTDATGSGTWSSSNVSAASVGSTTGIVTGMTTGSAFISYTLSGGCSTSVFLTVNPSPAVGTTGGGIATCSGFSVTLSGTGASSYSWTGGVVNGVPFTPPVGVDIYTVTGTTGSCSNTAIATVTVNAMPTVGSTGGGITVCQGMQVTLSGTGAAAYMWTGGVFNGVPFTPAVGINTYTVTGTSSAGCVTTATTTVTVNASPAISVFGGGVAICEGAAVTLFATGATSYSYSGGVFDGVPFTPAAGINTYTVTGTSSAGCSTAVTTTITVNPSPAVTVFGGDVAICEGVSVTFFATGATAYSWTGGVSEGVPFTPPAGSYSYTVTGTSSAGCTTAVTTTLTVNPSPAVTVFGGGVAICEGVSVTLFATGATAYMWTGGVSNGVPFTPSAGSYSYTVTGTSSAGCTTAVTTTLTVNPLPAVTVFGGNVSICEGVSVALFATGAASYSYTGGVSDGVPFTPVAGIDTYTVTGTSSSGCSTAVTTTITVNPSPAVTVFGGGVAICEGFSVTLFATGATAYMWTGGVSNGVPFTPGVGSYTYTVTGTSSAGCTTAVSTTLTVNPMPVVGSTGGGISICSGVAVVLTGTGAAAYTWSGGVLNGVPFTPAVGINTYTVTGTSSAGCATTATTTITVNSTSAGIITGPSTVTAGSNITLTDATTGGTWSSSNGSATVAGGVVHGVAAGIVTISYSVTSAGCTGVATKVITVGTSTVTSTVAAITGYYFYLCQNATAPFFDVTSGGSWSINAADAAVASVSASGVVTGIAAGTARLSYTVGSAYATAVVTVYPVPAAITGSGVCIGQTTALTDASTGGVWSSGIPSYASISTGGIVTGNIAGMVPIYYTLVAPAGCKTTFIITVNPNPAGITGPTSVCVGSSVQLTDVTSGGIWSSGSSNITVGGSGSITGVATGSATVTYTVAGCSRTYNITVNGASAGTINGASSVTIGLNTTLTDAVAGGVWSASNSNATVSATGVVTGVAAGTVTISYTVSGGCGSVTATYVVTVNASGISGITGTTIVCIGTTTSLTDATPGGTWHSSSTSIATVGTSGVVTGVAAGTATISYIVAGSPVTIVVTVTSMPSGIGGATSVCNGSAITLSDFTAGGTWTSTAGVSVTNGTTVTTVTGLTDGTNTVTYSLGTGCFRTFAVTVKPVPTPILGNLNVCGLGAVTFLSDATSGISWAINPVGTATISPSGRVYGVSAGTATVTYTATNGCVTTAIATVNSAISVAAILGATNVSHGATITLSDATSGGAWSSSNSALGSVDGAGNVTGVGTSGTVTITYAVPYGSGCVAAATKTITVHTPAPHTVVTTTVGMTVSVSDEAMGGEWTSSDGSVAVVDANGTVTALAAGAATITHKSPTGSGEAAIQTTMVQVNDVALDAVIIPNPNQGIFTVRGRVATDALITYQVTDMTGQIIYTSVSTAKNGLFNERIKLSNTLANGAYLLDIKTGNQHQVLHFIVAQ